MMYNVDFSTKFKKDYKRAIKRGLNSDLIEDVMLTLRKNGKLPSKYKPHILKGNYSGLWECHIQPDWLLIWSQEDSIHLITLMRTGTHSDLF